MLLSDLSDGIYKDTRVCTVPQVSVLLGIVERTFKKIFSLQGVKSAGAYNLNITLF